ncbi:hypothetical protein BU15DRAFT_90063 [Melanogaster broomeanus]|nr:hypothetical protein BU15DRAFT_90063 [Melanogaster broomeanus]
MDSELPGYSSPVPLPAPSPVPYILYRSEDSKGHKWLTLTVKSRALQPASPPCFYQGDTVSGQVTLDVPKSEAIKGITIKVTAGTTFVGQDEQIFLKLEKELWTPSMPLPDGSTVSKFGKGKYTWPFSLTLPTEVEVQDQKIKKKFPLPPTFSEKASAGYLDYKLIATVKRGALRVNQTLYTSISYIPLTRPQPPSPMVQKAYKENLPLVGPEGDPDGWHVLPSVTVQGKVFDSRSVEVAFVAIRLLMVRSLATGSDATDEDIERRGDNFFLENVARAVFWAPENGSAPGKRVLQGEVEVKRSLKPSALFPKFTTRYHMDLHPFEVPGFVATAPKSGPLLTQKVTVVNFSAPGITMRSHAPPQYVQEQAADFNNSVGLLENGNQRFYHHGTSTGF